MQIRANTKAVNHWFIMLFIVLIFLYFIGYVLALGTELERSLLLSFFYMFIFINSNLFRQRIEDIFLGIFQKKSYTATEQNQIFLLPLNSYEYSQITF